MLQLLELNNQSFLQIDNMKKIGTYCIIVLFALIALKSCIVTSVSFDDIILLEHTDERGESNRVIITPKREMILGKRFQELSEIGIYEIKGNEATHYIFDLYCLGNFPLGLRYYKNAEKVIDAELILKHKEGESFPKIGSSFRNKIVIFSDKAIIGNIIYQRLPLNATEKIEIKSSIEALKRTLF